MARKGQYKLRNANSAAGRRVSSKIDTTKKPTNLYRTLVAILSASLKYGPDVNEFPTDEVMNTVDEHAVANDETLGPRTARYVEYALLDLAHKRYISSRVEVDGTHVITMSRPFVGLIKDIEREMCGNIFDSKMSKHRAYCDHFRRKIGPIRRPTCKELLQEVKDLHEQNQDMYQQNRSLRQDMEAHRQICPIGFSLESNIGFGSISDVNDSVITLFTTPDNAEDAMPIAGPSSRSTTATIFPTYDMNSPVRLLNSDPQAAYPSPESLPRQRIIRTATLSPPPSPTPKSRSLILDEHIIMDVDEETASSPRHDVVQDLQRETDMLKSRVSELEENKNELNAKLNAANVRCLDLEHDVRALQEEKALMAGNIKDLQEQLTNLNQELATTKQEKRQSEDRVTELLEEQAVLRQLIKDQKIELDDYRATDVEELRVFQEASERRRHRLASRRST